MILRNVKKVYSCCLSLIYGGYRLFGATSHSLARYSLPSLVLAATIRQRLVRQIHPLSLLSLLRKLLLLETGRPLAPIKATDHVRRASLSLIQEVLVCPQRLLGQEMVGSGDLIVSVGLDTFHRVVGIVIKFIKHHLI